MNTMVACAIDQMFQRQLKMEDAIIRIEETLSVHPDESINLAKVSHLTEEDYEELDEVSGTAKN